MKKFYLIITIFTFIQYSYSQTISQTEADHVIITYITDTTNDIYNIQSNEIHNDIFYNVFPEQDPNGLSWGLKDTITGKMLTDYKYQSIYWFSDSLARVQSNGKFGFIDCKGEEVIKPYYRRVSSFKNGYAIVFPPKYVSPERYYFINKKNERLPKNKYWWVPDKEGFNFEHKRLIVQHGQEYAVVDFKDNIIVQFGKYDKIKMLNEGTFLISKGDMYGIIDKDGHELLSLMNIEFQHPNIIREGLLIVSKDGYKGVIDCRGQELFYTNFDYIYPFINGIAKVYKNNKIGYINRKGKVIIPVVNLVIKKLGMKIFAVRQYDKYRYLHINNDSVKELNYSHIQSYKGVLKAISDKGVTYLNYNGKPTVNPDYIYLNDKYLKQQSDTNYQLIDSNDRVLNTLNYDEIIALINPNYFIVKKNNKYGMINYKFEIQEPLIYDYFWGFSSAIPNKAIHHNDGRVYYLYNEKGRGVIIDSAKFVIMSDAYIRIEDFKFGIATITKHNKFGLMNLNYQIVTPPIYDNIGEFQGGMAIVSKNTKYGFINLDGKEIIPPIYDEVSNFHDGSADVKKDGIEYYIDTHGNIEVYNDE